MGMECHGALSFRKQYQKPKSKFLVSKRSSSTRARRAGVASRAGGRSQEEPRKKKQGKSGDKTE